MEPSQLRGEGGDVGVGLLPREHGESGLHTLDSLVDLVPVPQDLSDPRGDPSGRMRQPHLAEQAGCLLEMCERCVALSASAGHGPGLFQKLGALNGIVGEVGCPFVVPPGLLGGAQGPGSRARASQGVECPAADLAGVGRLGRGPVRVHEVRCHHLDHLVLVVAGGARQEIGSGQMSGPALLLRQGLVRDPPHQVLQERELPSLG